MNHRWTCRTIIVLTILLCSGCESIFGPDVEPPKPGRYIFLIGNDLLHSILPSVKGATYWSVIKPGDGIQTNVDNVFTDEDLVPGNRLLHIKEIIPGNPNNAGREIDVDIPLFKAHNPIVIVQECMFTHSCAPASSE
jgi:hypothetical protein